MVYLCWLPRAPVDGVGLLNGMVLALGIVGGDRGRAGCSVPANAVQMTIYVIRGDVVATGRRIGVPVGIVAVTFAAIYLIVGPVDVSADARPQRSWSRVFAVRLPNGSKALGIRRHSLPFGGRQAIERTQARYAASCSGAHRVVHRADFAVVGAGGIVIDHVPADAWRQKSRPVGGGYCSIRSVAAGNFMARN